MQITDHLAALETDYEFAALKEARNYRAALRREFAPALRGRILEVGAGVGQFTAELRTLPGVTEIAALEPDPKFHPAFTAALPNVRLFPTVVAGLPPGESWDAIVAVNVLEHIEKDAEELAAWRTLLEPTGGRVCLLVPARPEIYAPIDKDFGHFRRYTKGELRTKLAAAGLNVERLHYFNCIGYLGWWWVFCVRRQRHFTPATVRFFDRWIFPLVYGFERSVAWPPVGQSLLAVASATRKPANRLAPSRPR